jgi:hypothetical protein
MVVGAGVTTFCAGLSRLWPPALLLRESFTPALREGMLEEFSRGSYLILVDHNGRLFRDAKAAISGEVAEVFERLGTSAETWKARLQKLNRGRLLGRFFGASRERLREVAERLGLRCVPNLGGCRAT